MDEKKKDLDFSKIYNLDPTYIHSSTINFENSLIKNNISDDIEDLGIDNLRKLFADEIRKEIEFFESIEDQIVMTLKKNYKGSEEDKAKYFANRETFLLFLNDFRDKIEAGEITGNGTEALFKFKKFIINTKPILEKFRENVKEIKKEIELTKIQDSQKIKKQYGESVKDVILFSLSDTEKKKFIGKELDEIATKEIEKKEKPLKDFMDEYSELLADIVKTTLVINYPDLRYQHSKPYEEVDKKIKTNAAKFRDLLRQWGVSLPENIEKMPENLAETIRNSLDKIPVWERLALFQGQNAENFIVKKMKSSQFQTILGEIFEDSLYRSFIDEILKKDGFFQEALPLDKVQLLGNVPGLSKWYTTDLQIAEVEMNKQQIGLGLSLKLKTEDKLSLGNQRENLKEYWKVAESFIEKEQMNKYQYMRKNIIWSLFAQDGGLNDKTESDLKVGYDKILSFEKEVFSILIFIRMTAGLFERGEEQKRKMMGSGSEELIYTGYLFGANKVYSFSQILREVFNLSSGGNISFVIPLDSGKWTPDEIKFPMNKMDLYKKKREAWNNLSEKTNNINYKELFYDTNLKSAIKQITDAIGEHSLYKISPAYTIKK